MPFVGPDTDEQVGFVGPESDEVVSTPSSPGVGELRRREGQGDIAAKSATGIGELRRREGQDEIKVEPTFPPYDIRSYRATEPGVEEFAAMERADPGSIKRLAKEDLNMARKVGVFGASVVAPELAIARWGMGAAAAKATPTLLNLAKAGAAQGAVSVLAGGAADLAAGEILGERPSFKEAAGKLAKETGVGALGGGVIGAATKPIVAGAMAAKELFTAGKDRLGRAAAQVFRPKGNASKQALAIGGARQAILKETGVEVPVSIGEVVGDLSIPENKLWMVNEGSHLTPEQTDKLKRLVLMTATMEGTGMSSSDLAERTVGALQKKVGELSKPTQLAIKELSDELQPAINNAMEEVRNQAVAAIPGTAATHTTAGTRLRNILGTAWDEITPVEREAYEKARSLANWEDLTVVPVSLKQRAQDVVEATPKSSALADPEDLMEGAIPSLMPAASRRFVRGIAEMSDQPSLQQMLGLRSEIGQSLRNPELMPGVSFHDRNQMYKAITEDIDAAFAAMPGEVGEAWRKAWEVTRNKSARFSGKPVENILNEFGAEGGGGPAGIAAKLESKDAPSVIAAIKTAAGPTKEADIDQTIGQFLFNQSATAGRNASGAGTSVADSLDYIRRLQPEIRARYFPNESAVRALASRESAVAGVREGADKIIKNLAVDDPALLAEALGPTSTPAVMKRLQTAIAESAKLDAQFKGTVMQTLRKGNEVELTEAVMKNPQNFVNSITDGTFSPANTKRALELIAKEDPTLVGELQFRFVDNMLRTYQSRGLVNTTLLGEDLARGTSLKAQTELSQIAETVLGQDKIESMRKMLKAWSTFEKEGSALTPSSPLVDLAARAAGGVVGSTVGRLVAMGPIGAANEMGRLAKLSPHLKYRLASYFLKTPELRKMALTPLGELTRGQINDLTRGFASSMIGTYVAEDSPEAEELRPFLKSSQPTPKP